MFESAHQSRTKRFHWVPAGARRCHGLVVEPDRSPRGGSHLPQPTIWLHANAFTCGDSGHARCRAREAEREEGVNKSCERWLHPRLNDSPHYRPPRLSSGLRRSFATSSTFPRSPPTPLLPRVIPLATVGLRSGEEAQRATAL